MRQLWRDPVLAGLRSRSTLRPPSPVTISGRPGGPIRDTVLPGLRDYGTARTGLLGSRLVGLADAPAGDPEGNDAEEEFPLPARPGVDARFQDRGALFFAVHGVRGALDENAPALPCDQVEVVDLEGHLVLGAGYSGPEVLVERAVLCRAEHDGSLVQLVIDRKDCHAGLAGVRDPANAAKRHQPHALGLVQVFQDRFAGRWRACRLGAGRAPWHLVTRVIRHRCSCS